MKNKYIRQYYAIILLSAIAFSFFNPILYIFMISQGFSHAEAGVFLSIFFIVSFLTEVPCGAITDTIGTRSTLFCSFILRGTGLLLILLNNVLFLYVAAIFCAIAESFQSGTLQSWIVNNLKRLKIENSLNKVFSRANSIGSVVSIVCGFVTSRYLFQINVKFPILLSVLLFYTLAIAVFYIIEKETTLEKLSLKSIIKQSVSGIGASLSDYITVKSNLSLISLLLLPSLLDVGPSNQWQVVFGGDSLVFLSGYIWVFISISGLLASLVSQKIKANNNVKSFQIILIISTVLVGAIKFIKNPLLQLLLFIIYIFLFTINSIRSNVILHQEIVNDDKRRNTLVSIFYAIDSLLISILVFINGVLSTHLELLSVWLLNAIVTLMILLVFNFLRVRKKSV